jgi:hypothetical protein
MPATIVIRCPFCHARIKAPAQLVGQSRPCPGCGRDFAVRRPTPADVRPSLLACRVELGGDGRWPRRRRVGK